MARYTALEQHDVARILAAYPIDVEEIRPIAGGAANSSYLLRTAPMRYVLTVLDNHEPASARRLAELLRHLAHHGVPVGRPLSTHDGVDLTDFNRVPVLVKEYLPGRSEGPLQPNEYENAGRLLAQIHAVPVPPWLADHGRRLPRDWTAETDAFPDVEFATWLRDQVDRTAPVERLSGPYGLVHGDYFPDNLVVGEDGRIAVLDWETASHDLLVLDVGMALLGLCLQDGRLLATEAASFLRGYTKTRMLTSDERGTLLSAIRYAAAIIAYHRYRRHHLTHPDPTKQLLYREIPSFVDSLETQWTDLATAVGVPVHPLSDAGG